MNDTVEARTHALRRLFLIAGFILVIGVGFYTGRIKVTFTKQEVATLQSDNLANSPDYIQGYEDALDCRAMLSAPACDVVLKHAQTGK